jgi:hypothetical protein
MKKNLFLKEITLKKHHKIKQEIKKKTNKVDMQYGV